MRRDGFFFRRKVDAIERHFGHIPFVFLHGELRNDLERLLSDMENFIGGRAPSRQEISIRQVNKSVGYYPAKLLRRLNALTRSELNPLGRYDLNHPTLERLKLTPRVICKHWLALLPSPPFLSTSETSAIDEFYREDWEWVRSYAETRQERAGRLLD